jgi:hypothetical protein
MNCTAGNERYDSNFCIISHQALNGFDRVRISGGGDLIGFARWGVFSSRFKQCGIDCRALPGFTLLAAARKSDNARAEFDLAEFVKNATIEQVKTVKSILCIFQVGSYIDSIVAAVRQDITKIQTEDRSRRATGPASGKRMRQSKDKIPAGAFRATT